LVSAGLSVVALAGFAPVGDRKPLFCISKKATTSMPTTTAITPISPHGIRRCGAFSTMVTGLMALLAPVARRPSTVERSAAPRSSEGDAVVGFVAGLTGWVMGRVLPRADSTGA